MPKTSPSSPSLTAYAIAFKHDTASRKRLTSTLGGLGMRVEFVDAIPGDSIDAETKQSFLNPARQYRSAHVLQDNAVGCAFCHYRIWQEILNKNLPYAFVFEDDAIYPHSGDAKGLPGSHSAGAGIPPSQRREAEEIGGRLRRLAELARVLDVVFLATRKPDLPYVNLARLDAMSNLVAMKYNDFGAHAYFISNRAARHLLTHPNRHIYEVDFHMHHWWRHNCQILHLMPSAFTHSGRASSIGYDRDRAWQPDYFYHRFARRFNRSKDSLVKRAQFPFYIRGIRTRLKKAGLELW